MHARCWPYADDGKNLLKLGSEVALMLVFLATAVLRSSLTKQDLVDAKLLREENLTEEERDMPELLSVFMVLVSVLIPFTIFLYNKFKKSDEMQDCDNPLSAEGIDIDTGRTSSSTKKTKQKPEKENKPTKRESASKRNTKNTKMENPMFDAAGSSESDEEESPTGSVASAKAAREKQMQT